MAISTLTEFKAWQKARVLCQNIYHLILSNESLYDYPLKNQLNRSSGSVMDNIAEGLGRNTHKEFIQFLVIALGSLMEVRSQLHRAVDRQYIDTEQLFTLLSIIDEIQRMLNALIVKLQAGQSIGKERRF